MGVGKYTAHERKIVDRIMYLRRYINILTKRINDIELKTEWDREKYQILYKKREIYIMKHDLTVKKLQGKYVPTPFRS